MGIKTLILEEVCTLAARQLLELYPELQAMFVPHEAGTFAEIVTTGDYGVIRHPAARTARTILEKKSNREHSSFLGLAIHQQVKWLGLTSEDFLLALFNINTDEFEDAIDLRRNVYHMLWHAIDLVEIRRRPEYAVKFRTGPMIPKRSPLNLARLNLQADVFSAVMCRLQGEDDALETLARRRAADSLHPLELRRAEDYPYAIALEAAQYAVSELLAVKPPRPKYMFYARQVAMEVGKTFGDESIRHWWSFAEPAQDMAWRKFPPDFILGCAVNTSEDPFVRATGHLVADIAEFTPLEGPILDGTYNAFANKNANKILHREIMEKTFEEAIRRGIAEESGQPLLLAAHAQNERLSEGLILGWCANALHAAGRAFESALKTGIAPGQAARLEFEGSKDSASWEALKKIGDTIIKQKRIGKEVTMGGVADMCGSNPAFAAVVAALKITMNDPAYLEKLEIANDLALPSAAGPAPQSLKPREPAPSTPALQGPQNQAQPLPVASGLPAPGLGSGGGALAAYMARQRMLAEQTRQSAETSED